MNIYLFFYVYNYLKVNTPALPEPSLRENKHFKNEAKKIIKYCINIFYVTLTLQI